MMLSKLTNSLAIMLIFLAGGGLFTSCQDEITSEKVKKTDTLEDLGFNNILSEKTITIKIKNFCYDNTMKRSDFFIQNLNTRVENAQLLPDLDGDGVPDARDSNETLNIVPTLADSNADGYSDLLVFRLGYTPEEQMHLATCVSPGDDADYDGMNDCMERSVRSNHLNFDTDDDGIPDMIELRMGLDPINGPGEGSLDLDGDGLTNLDEMRANTPIDESNEGYVALFAVKYDSSKIPNTQQECFDYTISNIPITEQTSSNSINLYVIEQDKSNLKKYLSLYTFIIPSSVEHKMTFEWTQEQIQSFFVGRSP